MLRTFEKKLVEYRTVKKGEGLIVAVSGGVDSVVLFDLLSRLSKSWRLNLSIAHVNYGLRGKASASDEKLVRNLASNKGVPFYTTRWKKENRANFQDAARRYRYKFFNNLAKKVGAGSIATGHNLNDQVETLLMHLIRGAGIKGLMGMNPVTFDNPKIVRPLLFFDRNDIESYAKKRKLIFAQDKTNAKVLYRRNYIRHNVLPVLQKLNPCVNESLFDVTLCLRDYDEAIDAVAHEFAEGYFIKKGDELSWDREHFWLLPRAIRRRVLILAYEILRGNKMDLNSDQIERMDEISSGNKIDGRYMLPGNFKFIRRGGFLAVSHDILAT